MHQQQYCHEWCAVVAAVAVTFIRTTFMPCIGTYRFATPFAPKRGAWPSAHLIYPHRAGRFKGPSRNFINIKYLMPFKFSPSTHILLAHHCPLVLNNFQASFSSWAGWGELYNTKNKFKFAILHYLCVGYSHLWVVVGGASCLFGGFIIISTLTTKRRANKEFGGRKLGVSTLIIEAVNLSRIISIKQGAAFEALRTLFSSRTPTTFSKPVNVVNADAGALLYVKWKSGSLIKFHFNIRPTGGWALMLCIHPPTRTGGVPKEPNVIIAKTPAKNDY